jgi:ribosomal protein L11 methyltransferase
MALGELLVLAPVDRVEWISDALEALQALSVSVEDADAQTQAEQALFGEPGMPLPQPGWQRSRVVALFESQALAAEAARLLLLQDEFEGCECLGVGEVIEQDWVRLTQAQFAPIAITDHFWIVPSWHEAPPQARQIIRLDPGLAFGTGSHPTTGLCLAWMAGGLLGQAQNPPSLGRVIDYGCGSGILAIGAALFGAQSIDAVDIDAAALQATEANAQANGVVLRVGEPAMACGPYDTVVANILATPLKLLAPLLCSLVAPGGHLVLAGILERQADELRVAYAAHCDLQVAQAREGWVLMTARF